MKIFDVLVILADGVLILKVVVHLSVSRLDCRDFLDASHDLLTRATTTAELHEVGLEVWRLELAAQRRVQERPWLSLVIHLYFNIF